MCPAGKDVAVMRATAVEVMLASLASYEPRTYFVSLVGYYIEGIPYSASGLSVSFDATPDLHRTDAGFACTAFFPPHLLEPETVEANGTVSRPSADETILVVPVHLEVELIDIWGVSEFINGVQCDLFQDEQTFISRFDAFGGGG
jgi:hypothetical protein